MVPLWGVGYPAAVPGGCLLQVLGQQTLQGVGDG